MTNLGKCFLWRIGPIMRFFHVQDPSCLSSQQMQNSIAQETSPLLPSGSFLCGLALFVPHFLFNFPYHIILKTGVCLGSESCLGMSQSEQQRESPTEESRIKYAMPSLDRGLQKRKTSKDKVCKSRYFSSSLRLHC